MVTILELLAMTAAGIYFGRGTGSATRLWIVGVSTAVGLHIAAGYVLLQAEAVHPIVREAAPLFVEFIGLAVAPSAPPVVAPKVVVPPEQKALPLLIPTPALDETPTIVEAPPLAAPAVPISPVLEVPVATVITVPPATLAPPAPQPKLVSGIEYVRPPQPEYPTLSRRMNEEGRVIVRVLINPQGRPEQALVHLSSRSSRLDQAAINAVLAALFKPHTENGMALHVYALIPITFELSQ